MGAGIMRLPPQRTLWRVILVLLVVSAVVQVVLLATQ
jgi:hypothetical protein